MKNANGIFRGWSHLPPPKEGMFFMFLSLFFVFLSFFCVFKFDLFFVFSCILEYFKPTSRGTPYFGNVLCF